MSGAAREPRIVPFRGDYLVPRPERRHLVKGLVYPVPDPAFPFLGIHTTVRLDGEVLLGPNAVLAFAREGYRRRDVSLRDLRETLRSAGFRPGAAALADWLRRARARLSTRRFVAAARKLLPELEVGDVLPAPPGSGRRRSRPTGRSSTTSSSTRPTASSTSATRRRRGRPSLAIAEVVATGWRPHPDEGEVRTEVRHRVRTGVRLRRTRPAAAARPRRPPRDALRERRVALQEDVGPGRRARVAERRHRELAEEAACGSGLWVVWSAFQSASASACRLMTFWAGATASWKTAATNSASGTALGSPIPPR